MNRKFTSLFLAFVSIFVLGTGLILFFMKNGYLKAFHEVMGVAMVVCVLIHVVHNMKPLKNYVKSTTKNTQQRFIKISKEFIVAMLVVGVLTVGSALYGADITEKHQSWVRPQAVSQVEEQTAFAVELVVAKASVDAGIPEQN